MAAVTGPKPGNLRRLAMHHQARQIDNKVVNNKAGADGTAEPLHPLSVVAEGNLAGAVTCTRGGRAPVLAACGSAG